ncbi:cytochrome c oxidase subunit II [Halomarina rubra]|uniref:cytochrome-c oxidase n=1 Tax=Halomarina rubra TaxID=2071873 RepID=A0ABD6AQM1_9EURY|nr:cytochrome c oxidase subunit II [Halomarina rubra]
MQQARRMLGVLTGLFALVILADPVAAQSSVNEELIFGLNRKLLYVAVPITVLVEGILIYTVYRFRDNDTPKPTQENRRLEITWTVATAIILLFVGLASYQVLGTPFIGGGTATAETTNDGLMELSFDKPGAKAPENPDDAVQVEVKAQKYFWQINHQNPGGQNVTATDTLVIPANQTVYLHVTSKDWLHAVHVPGLALKQDAFPGQYNTIITEATEKGSYQLYCAEYCGISHSNMLGEVRVVSQEEYQQYLQENSGSGGSGGNASGNSTGNSTNASGNATSASLVAA